jgi:hypothetical protein
LPRRAERGCAERARVHQLSSLLARHLREAIGIRGRPRSPQPFLVLIVISAEQDMTEFLTPKQGLGLPGGEKPRTQPTCRKVQYGRVACAEVNEAVLATDDRDNPPQHPSAESVLSTIGRIAVLATSISGSLNNDLQDAAACCLRETESAWPPQQGLSSG